MHKTSKGGTYRLDRQFRGVGRIAVASGATTARDFHARNDLLSRLYRAGRFDLLTAIQGGQLSITEVLAADRADSLDTLTGERGALAKPLWTAVETWLGRPLWGDAAEKWTGPALSPTTRRYSVSFTMLHKATINGVPALSASATVEALAGVNWRALRPSWAPSAASWNHLRRAVLTFLTAHLGDVDHPFRKQVRKAFGKLEREVHRVPDLTPGLFWTVVRAAPLHAQSCFVALVATGLRVGEFLRLQETDLLPHTCSVRVPGTKTAASAATVRVSPELWPWVKASVPSPLAYKWLRLYWKRALKAVKADDTLRLHDLRHAHGQWAVNAGVPEAAVQASLRHTNRAMTARYTAQRDRGTVASALAEVLLKPVPLSVPLSENQVTAEGA